MRQSHAVEKRFVQEDSIQFVLYRLSSGAGVHQIGGGKRIGHRQSFALNRRKPGPLDLDRFVLHRDFARARALRVAGFLDQSQIIERHCIVRVLRRGLFQFGFGLLHPAHFVEHFAVLRQRSRGDPLFLHLGNQGLDLLAGHPPL